MAIFSKTEEKDKNQKEQGVVSADKKVTKKTDTDSKSKKVSKPKTDAGMNLTKVPGRIIKAPRITEKALKMTMKNTYVFEVTMDVTKRDVITAVHALYGVIPVKVNMVRKKPQAYVARSRNRRGTKSGLKKAYVFLKKGEKIDIA